MPALLLVNFRPEFHATWMSKSYYQQIALGPLGPHAVRELISSLLGEDPTGRGLPERIHARTGGNPFFTEEIVQSLIEDGSLEGGRGAYRPLRPIESLPLPPTVNAVLAARIDRLPEEQKQVLQTAAVIKSLAVRSSPPSRTRRPPHRHRRMHRLMQLLEPRDPDVCVDGDGRELLMREERLEVQQV